MGSIFHFLRVSCFSWHRSQSYKSSALTHTQGTSLEKDCWLAPFSKHAAREDANLHLFLDNDHYMIIAVRIALILASGSEVILHSPNPEMQKGTYYPF